MASTRSSCARTRIVQLESLFLFFGILVHFFFVPHLSNVSGYLYLFSLFLSLFWELYVIWLFLKIFFFFIFCSPVYSVDFKSIANGNC